MRKWARQEKGLTGKKRANEVEKKVRRRRTHTHTRNRREERSSSIDRLIKSARHLLLVERDCRDWVDSVLIPSHPTSPTPLHQLISFLNQHHIQYQEPYEQRNRLLNTISVEILSSDASQLIQRIIGNRKKYIERRSGKFNPQKNKTKRKEERKNSCRHKQRGREIEKKQQEEENLEQKDKDKDKDWRRRPWTEKNPQNLN